MDFPSRPAVFVRNPNGAAVRSGSGDGRGDARPRDFLIVVDHAEIVRNLKPDTAALAKIDMGISGGAIVTASGDMTSIMWQVFAPSEGIDERMLDRINPVHTPSRYWAGRTGKQTFRVQQTQFSRRRMWCTLVGDRVKGSGK